MFESIRYWRTAATTGSPTGVARFVRAIVAGAGPEPSSADGFTGPNLPCCRRVERGKRRDV
ncbi:MAG TPA: hypothetical protein VMS00_02385, partial [Acidimicrobiales bacterium]|nr:hypothetical protein [Acidimicrobiales bacterium]